MPGETPTPTTPTPTSGPTNSTTTETAGGATGGGGGGVLPEFPDGWELLSGALQGALRSFAGGVEAAVSGFNRHLLTLPAAGDAANPATWSAGGDPYWTATATVYVMLSAPVLPLVWGVGWFNVAVPRGLARRERIKNVGLAVGFIVGGWPVLQLWLHSWNQAALAFAPAGAEFLATPGSTSKLSVGVALGVALLLSKAVVVLAGLLIHLIFVFLTFAFVALWPLSVALYLTDVPAVDAIGNAGVSGMLMLSPLQFIKAVLLRLLFELPLDGSAATLSSFLLIVVGVLLAFVAVPYFGLKRLLPRTVVSAGRRAGRRGGEQMGDLSDRAPSRSDLRDRVASVGAEARARLGQRGAGGSGDGSSLQSRSRDGGSGATGETLRARLDARDDTRTRTNSATTDDD